MLDACLFVYFLFEQREIFAQRYKNSPTPSFSKCKQYKICYQIKRYQVHFVQQTKKTHWQKFIYKKTTKI